MTTGTSNAHLPMLQKLVCQLKSPGLQKLKIDMLGTCCVQSALLLLQRTQL